MLKTLVVAAGTLALITPALAAPTRSAGPQAPDVRTISTAGVDFRDPAAVSAFYRRLRDAAGAVCDSYAANSRVTSQDVACTENALAKAVRELDRPLLTALHDGGAATLLAAARH